MLKWNRLFMLVVAVLLSFSSNAQNRKELENKKGQLKSDIAYQNKLLEETKKSKKQSLNQLVLLNKKIKERQELLYTLQIEVAYVEEEIDKKEEMIEEMRSDLATLREEYAQMIRQAYKVRNPYDKVMFIFASDDFNQAYKRIRYLQQYSDLRKRQAANIERLEQLLTDEIAALEEQRKEKTGLIADMSNETEKLSGEKQQKQSLYEDLQDKEKELKAEIRKKQEEQAAIQKAIERIIEEELRKAREASASSSTEWELTPEAAALANSFTSNKGQLPWPVEQGVITQGYGRRPHPVLKQLTINNNGVTISTSEGSAARAVYRGEVHSVIIVPGAGKAVIIQHGDYLTVYGNLSEVYVTKGDQIDTKQLIGKVMTDQGKTELQFEIRKGQDAQTLDPSYWLFKGR